MRESGLKYLLENFMVTSPWQQFSINDYPPFTTSWFAVPVSLPVVRVRCWVRVGGSGQRKKVRVRVIQEIFFILFLCWVRGCFQNFFP